AGGGAAGGGGAVGGGGAAGGGAVTGVLADLQVTGSAQNGGPAVGSADSFTFQVRNNGATSAPGAALSVLLPPSLQFGSASASQGSCSGSPSGSSGGTLTCVLGTLAGGGTATVTVNFTPTQVGTFAASGFGTFSGTDANPQNNGFFVTVRAR
ncbi:MAG: DUF11 domain-containing protein, partial [Acidobacteriia bacterium]|nr:DUF11 domain-containing protein [Terriglobia bacterium]